MKILFPDSVVDARYPSSVNVLMITKFRHCHSIFLSRKCHSLTLNQECGFELPAL